jgi:outer membrane protein OmpA-like peptidoglycan-associated protein
MNRFFKHSGFILMSVFILIIFTNMPVQAQVIQHLKMKMANESYQKYLYGEAIPLYEEILHRDPTNMEAKKKLASCYRMSNDTRNSERLYGQLVVEDSIGLLNKLYYAQALAENGKYDLAKYWYKKYDNALAIDARGKRFLNSYNNIKKFYKDSTSWQIEFLSINSAQADFSPMFYKKGIVFCSARSQGGAVKYVYGWDQSAFLNLYYVEDTSLIKGKPFHTEATKDNASSHYDSTGHINNGHSEDTKSSGNDSYTLGYYGNTFLKEDEEWITASKHLVVPFNKKINSRYHEGPCSFSKNLDSMVFTRNGFHGGKLRKSKDGVSKLKIYSSRHEGDNWTTARPIKFNKFQYYVKFTGLNSFNRNTSESDTAYVKEIQLDDDQFSISHPCLSRDNKKLFFVSDAPIGFGGSDIYVCTWEGDHWSAPLNCGKNINTEGNEMFPYADDNGNLYFSSDGWGGIGGLDIYFSETELNIFGEKDNIFSKPINLGFPINSKKDDFGIIVDKDFTVGYFSSNRRKGANDDDIFRFRYVGASTITIQGMVLHKHTGTPMDSAKVVLRDLRTGLDSMITPKYGMFSFPKLSPGKDYILFVDRKGYHSQKINLNTMDLKRGDTCKVKIELEPKEIFIYVKGNVYGEDDKLPMANVRVKIYNNCTGQTDEILTDGTGNYSMRLKENCCYAISAIKDNCGVNSTVVSTVGIESNQNIPADFSMLCKGDVVKLDDIYYDLGKWDIRPEAAVQLDKLLVVMKKYPDMKIELRAHTDSRGDDLKNMTLSDQRAKSAEKYLESKGINVASISGKGYGETLPLNQCKNGVKCTEEEYQVNRRTEFKILSMGKPMPLAKINASLAGNCQNYVENIIKKEEESNREPEYKPTPVSTDLLDAFAKKEPNPNSILKEEPKVVTPPVEVKKEEPKVVTPSVEVKKEEPKIVTPVVVKKEEPKVVTPQLEVKKEEPKVVTPVIVKKEEPKVVTPPVEVKKEEPKVVTPPVEVKKEEPKVVTPVVVKKEEPKVVTPPVEVKKEEPKIVTPPAEVKKEEPKIVTPVIVKKEEPKVVTPPVEVKKEEPKVVTPPVEVKKEEPKVVTPVVVKKEEPKVVTPPVEVKKEEPKVVTPPVEVKKEEPKVVTPVVVKKEEPKVVTPPVEVKKEEPKIVTPVIVKKEEPKVVTPPVEVKKEEPVEESDPFNDVFGSTEKAATSAIKGTVLKSGTSETLNGTKIILKSNGRKIDSITTVVNGGFMFSKLPPGANYEVYVSRKGYYDQKVTINSSGLQPGQTGTVKVALVNDPNQKDELEPSMVFMLKGKVVNEAKAPQAGVTVFLTNNIDKTTSEVKANQQGEYSFTLRRQCHYTVKATRGNCNSPALNKSTIGLQSSQTFDVELIIKCE